ncbi:teashirt homolog 2-like isoform X2 [Pecten maximus]|uniref:teashirt homolog 2-like isoform X2 n=1 Tax=Pecten maximus TaxID=6579 RepID=UPI0014584029|nr:teashirt homolog 2-like isoform X2 [Pecten maximus]
MMPANEENGCESGENEGIEEDKDNGMNNENSLDDAGGVENEDVEKEVVEKTNEEIPLEEEGEKEVIEGQDSDVDKSPMSSDTMPHHMDGTVSPVKEESQNSGKKDEDTKNSPSPPSRPETPPLQRLMRQDPLPLFLQKKQHTPPKKLFKDGFFPTKFPIPPMTLSAMSVIKNAPTHPKQTMAKAKMYSNKLPKSYPTPYTHSSAAKSPSSIHHSHHVSTSPSPRTLLEEQPLDLSKKANDKNDRSDRSDRSASKSQYKSSSNGHHSSGRHHMSEHHSSGGHHSSSSGDRDIPSTLQSLQQRFGGNLHMRSVRKPISGLLPVSSGISKSHSPMHLNSSSQVKNSNIVKKSHAGSVIKPPQIHSPNHSSRLEKNIEKSKCSSTGSEKDSSPLLPDTDLNSNITLKGSECDSLTDDCKYTMHRCTCLKTYNSLYGLSIHLQETGHSPASTKQAAIMEYPKLVRGQDMWLNQESEHTKRILRCMQCGESFKSLPLLTVHMMQTQHYTKIVSSEHGRRSHKCSAYCDREMDRECIFKCKVCNSTFSDMEGLANHMIMSGHHKKNILRSHNYLNDLAFRGRRKRYYSDEESFEGLGNPNVASFLNYKRKCLSHPVTPPMNGHRHFADSPDSEHPEDSTISCENCGDRIETQFFVEHVRLCLRTKQTGFERSRMSLFKDEVSSIKSEKSHDSQDLEDVDEETASMFDRPDDSEEEMDTKPDIQELDLSLNKQKVLNTSDKSKETKSGESSESGDKSHNEISTKEENGDDGREESKKCVNSKEHIDEDVSIPSPIIGKEEVKVNENDKLNEKVMVNENDKVNEKVKVNEMEKGVSSPHHKSPLHIADKIEDSPRKSPEKTTEDKKKSSEEKNDLKNLRVKVKKEEVSECDISERSKVLKNTNSAKNLDIIDPGRAVEDMEDNSALKAMESFIQKSFSSKFDYHRGNMVFNTGEKTLLKPSVYRDDKEHRHGALYRFEKYRKYFQQDEPRNNGSVKKCSSDVQDTLNVCLQPSSSISSAKDDLKKLEKMCESVRKPVSPSTDNEESQSTGNSENGETLASKYLNCEEEDNNRPTKDSRVGSSALDSLSSFVYGQPLNSEHPLDSLQKLITKTDLPKLLASSQSIKYLRQSESPDSGLPLNLSLKKGQDDDTSDILEREGFSDHEGSQHSGSESDGTAEYRCAACSRHFASKGSYRYHLSRCHLSSVKRYGIKEAFNMSPYVYLPLDHTAKFSKYYEMAHELASKGK